MNLFSRRYGVSTDIWNTMLSFVYDSHWFVFIYFLIFFGVSFWSTTLPMIKRLCHLWFETLWFLSVRFALICLNYDSIYHVFSKLGLTFLKYYITISAQICNNSLTTSIMHRYSYLICAYMKWNPHWLVSPIVGESSIVFVHEATNSSTFSLPSFSVPEGFLHLLVNSKTRPFLYHCNSLNIRLPHSFRVWSPAFANHFS